MRRRASRPYGHTVSPTRIVSLLFAVGLLWLFYERARDPATWRFMTGETDDAPAADVSKAREKATAPENLTRGLNDRDPGEAAEVRRLLELVTDRTELRPPEMAAYWRLMNWSRVERFADLEKRADGKVQFVQLWKQPDRYRGKLIRLRLHVRRVVDFVADRNDSPVPRVFEVWGTTDDSMSNPLVVILPELPQGLKVGSDVRGEVVFVGYFLKTLGYTGGDEKNRGAPLLVGRARVVRPASGAVPSPDRTLPWPVIALGGAAIIGLGLWSLIGSRRRPRRDLLADSIDGPPLPALSENPPNVPAFRFDFEQAPTAPSNGNSEGPT